MVTKYVKFKCICAKYKVQKTIYNSNTKFNEQRCQKSLNNIHK